MYTRFDDVDAKCPFYKGSDDKRISCEGIVEESIITVSFSSKKNRDTQRRIFCDDKFKNCEVYRMLNEKYTDD